MWFFVFFILGVYSCINITIELVSEPFGIIFDCRLIFKIILSYISPFVFAYFVIISYCGNITLNSTSIYVKNDPKKFGSRLCLEKIQYRASVKYSDIENIKIVSLRTNSKKKPVHFQVPYLVIANKKGKKVLFGLYFMTKRSVNSLLIELIKRVKATNKDFDADINKLVEDFSKVRCE